jgi:hypothetical protein
VKLTTHLDLMPRSRMRGAIPPHPPARGTQLKHRNKFTFTFYLLIYMKMEKSTWRPLQHKREEEKRKFYC